MGTLLASSVIASWRRIMLDPDAVTWDAAAALKLLNEAERAVCDAKPEINPVRGALSLVAGVNQTLPTNGLVLMDLYENVASGQGTRLVDRELQDAGLSTWAAGTQEKDVQEWCKDDRAPRMFRVMPPNDGTGQVMALYGALPAAIGAATDPINLEDRYESVLIKAMLSKAYAENTQRQDLTKSAGYEQSWRAELGLSTQNTNAATAKVQQVAGSK